jgi:hypothetical protein
MDAQTLTQFVKAIVFPKMRGTLATCAPPQHTD